MHIRPRDRCEEREHENKGKPASVLVICRSALHRCSTQTARHLQNSAAGTRGAALDGTVVGGEHAYDHCHCNIYATSLEKGWLFSETPVDRVEGDGTSSEERRNCKHKGTAVVIAPRQTHLRSRQKNSHIIGQEVWQEQLSHHSSTFFHFQG